MRLSRIGRKKAKNKIRNTSLGKNPDARSMKGLGDHYSKFEAMQRRKRSCGVCRKRHDKCVCEHAADD